MKSPAFPNAACFETKRPFDEAYEETDWGDFIDYPACAEANRRNAYGIFTIDRTGIATIAIAWPQRR